MVAAIFCGIAFAAAWVALFAPHILPTRKRILSPALAAMLGAVLVIAIPQIFALLAHLVLCLVLPLIIARPIVFLLILFAAAAAGAATPALFNHTRKTFLLLLSGLYALVAVPTIWSVATIDARSIDYSNWASLLWTHSLLIGTFLLLWLVMWYRFLKRTVPNLNLSIAATLVSGVSGIVAFVLTFPLEGDEISLLWLFIVPAFAVVAIALLLTAAPLYMVVTRDRKKLTTP